MYKTVLTLSFALLLVSCGAGTTVDPQAQSVSDSGGNGTEQPEFSVGIGGEESVKRSHSTNPG